MGIDRMGNDGKYPFLMLPCYHHSHQYTKNTICTPYDIWWYLGVSLKILGIFKSCRVLWCCNAPWFFSGGIGMMWPINDLLAFINTNFQTKPIQTEATCIHISRCTNHIQSSYYIYIEREQVFRHISASTKTVIRNTPPRLLPWAPAVRWAAHGPWGLQRW